MKRIIKKDIDENYGLKQGVIWIETTKCSVCGETAECLSLQMLIWQIMDGSQDEFFNGAICKKCIRREFKIEITEDMIDRIMALADDGLSACPLCNYEGLWNCGMGGPKGHRYAIRKLLETAFEEGKGDRKRQKMD